MTITIALPSKGRMKEDTLQTFQKAGMTVVTSGNNRSYTGKVEENPDIDIAFMSASEIAKELAKGTIDFGITGEDLARENIANTEDHVTFHARLGYGAADVVVAVPEFWYDVVTMSDLGDVAAGFRARHGRRLSIATKYWQLTQQFFSAQHGIQLYRIVESLGATEGAPAAGSADIIVDITSTGSTLKANHLRILSDGVILKSEACLVSSKKSSAIGSDLYNKISNSFS